MSNWIRKQRRNELKQILGTNKIHDEFHSKYDSLEKRLIAGMKRAKEDRLTNKK